MSEGSLRLRPIANRDHDHGFNKRVCHSGQEVCPWRITTGNSLQFPEIKKRGWTDALIARVFWVTLTIKDRILILARRPR